MSHHMHVIIELQEADSIFQILILEVFSSLDNRPISVEEMLGYFLRFGRCELREEIRDAASFVILVLITHLELVDTFLPAG